MTHSALVSCIERMKKRASLIKKRPQGHTDSKSDWACCRFCLAAQMLIHFGKDNPGKYLHLLNRFLDEKGDLSVCFDPALLPKLDLNSIAFYDVRHLIVQKYDV